MFQSKGIFYDFYDILFGILLNKIDFYYFSRNLFRILGSLKLSIFSI